jgi:large subunit ribosomal protein L11
LRKALGVEHGSGAPGTQIAGKLSSDKVREIAKIKMRDLNTFDIEKAARIVEGTARSMGIECE